MKIQKRPFNPRFGRPQKPQGPPHNEQIKNKEVRIVGAEPHVTNGVYPIREALDHAEKLEVDLIVINNNQEIPICRLMPLDKYMYEQKQKEKEKKKQAATTELHEVRLSPEISDNDMQYRIKKAIEWLKGGDKIKCSLQFRGRQIVHKDKGELVMLRFADSVKEAGQPESLPKLDGKKMLMILKPKPKK